MLILSLVSGYCKSVLTCYVLVFLCMYVWACFVLSYLAVFVGVFSGSFFHPSVWVFGGRVSCFGRQQVWLARLPVGDGGVEQPSAV